ncbi:hypothetical protein PSACC_01632 [Paramicrosporidium saccamoebae]|uniref:Uncharacterized protein n=1 Tax=Paramicrosporidium saccamoebae TaxID=1246581 RepID=A0A2H9TLD9_9FUNG|nr:hypothetical protein PSACC_01632 [Paramicrosporidium saccamoebae]
MAEILSSLAHRLNSLNIQLVADGCGIALEGDLYTNFDSSRGQPKDRIASRPCPAPNPPRHQRRRIQYCPQVHERPSHSRQDQQRGRIPQQGAHRQIHSSSPEPGKNVRRPTTEILRTLSHRCHHGIGAEGQRVR